MILVRFLWEMPQNLIGAVLFVILHFSGRVRSARFRNKRFVIRTKGTGFSFGFFVFYPASPNKPSHEEQNRRHLIGHSVQSMWLGPLYLPLVGIPILYRDFYRKQYRRRHKKEWRSYYRGFPEQWADHLGGVRYRHE